MARSARHVGRPADFSFRAAAHSPMVCGRRKPPWDLTMPQPTGWRFSRWSNSLSRSRPMRAVHLGRLPQRVERHLARRSIPVWLPAKMVLAAPEVPQSWDVTSDSLAAWLAGTLSARRLLLIKSRNIEVPASAHELAAEKTVDPMFPRFAELSQAEVWLSGPAALEGAAISCNAAECPAPSSRFPDVTRTLISRCVRPFEG